MVIVNLSFLLGICLLACIVSGILYRLPAKHWQGLGQPHDLTKQTKGKWYLALENLSFKWRWPLSKIVWIKPHGIYSIMRDIQCKITININWWVFFIHSIMACFTLFTFNKTGIGVVQWQNDKASGVENHWCVWGIRTSIPMRRMFKKDNAKLEKHHKLILINK